MSAAAIAALSAGSYAALAYVVVGAHDADRLTPRWLRRLAAWLVRKARALFACVGRAAVAVRFWVRRRLAVARVRCSLLFFSLHVLLFPMGVSR